MAADGTTLAGRAPRKRSAKAVRKALNAAVEQALEAVERAVAALDALEVDADQEPWLGVSEGTFNGGGRDQTYWAIGLGDDREDQADAEDSLGWSERAFLSGGESATSNELEDDGTSEPSLAAPEGAQTFSETRCGSSLELEEQSEDEGAQCEDEGFDADREPDVDAEREEDGRVEHAWRIGTRWAADVDGPAGEWRPLDPDDAPDPTRPPSYGYGCAG